MKRTYLGLAVTVSLMGMFSLSALADSAGRSGNSVTGCNGCHNGGQAPTVAFGGPAQVVAGSTNEFSFTVTSAAANTQTHAGLDVSVQDSNQNAAGTLAKGNGDGQILNGDLTQTGPKQNDGNGNAKWVFNWTAPATPGVYRFFGSGNSVNNDGTTKGDQSATVVFRVTVVAAPEPSTLAFLAVGLVGFVSFGRRRLSAPR